MPNARKVFLLGIDGLPPSTFRRFVAAGRMPRFAQLLERALTIDLVPTLPALTSPGWLSIASGAYPSTVGVENILLPTPGQAPDVIRNGFDSEFSQAEYLWETLDRCGLPAIVLKYPGSWPLRPGRFVQVDGAGGYADISCRFEVTSSRAYTADLAGRPGNASTASIFPAGYENHWRTHTGPAQGLIQVVTRPPMGWRNLPAAARPAFECVLHMEQRNQRARQVTHGLAYERAGQACLALAPTKDASAGHIHLRAGRWSDWVQADSPSGPYAYRFKLLDLDLQQERLHLYRSEGHRLDGFTRPPELAGELIGRTGPMVEWTGAYDLMNGLIDLETQLEIYQQHTAWLAQAIRYLADSRPWRGFFTQWHVIEYAHHLVGASLHAEHPLHRPENAARDLEFLGGVYALADQLLQAVEAVIDEETLLVVASDHGHDLVHTVFYVNHFLRRRGWLTTTMHAGRPAVDWTRTAAYALFPGCIFFNVAGRWPGGILSPAEASALAPTVCEALRSLVDPHSGRHPVRLILDREELAAFGQAGPRAPDLFFCLERGYEPASRILDGAPGAVEFEWTTPYREVTSGHGSFFPASPSARTLALLAGPGVPPRSQGRYPRPVVDLAPTMAAHLGIPPPRHCEGHAIDVEQVIGAV